MKGRLFLVQLLLIVALLVALTSRGFTQTPSLMFLGSSAGPVPWTGTTGGVPSVHISGGTETPDSICLDGTNQDTCLVRDAANVLGQRNGTTAQEHRVYNTFTSSTSYEAIRMYYTGNVAVIEADKGSGGGTGRTLNIGTVGANALNLVTSGNNQWTVNSTGTLTSTGLAFASLGTPSNGTFVYCTDCTVANPCAGSGTGALAKRLNGAWTCN